MGIQKFRTISLFEAVQSNQSSWEVSVLDANLKCFYFTDSLKELLAQLIIFLSLEF